MLSFLPVQRALFGGVAIMGGPPPGLVADLLLDFQNGVYRKDGVTDTFSNLGGTNTGTVTGGTGLTCTGAQLASIPYNVTGPFVIVGDHDYPATAAFGAFLIRRPAGDVVVHERDSVSATPQVAGQSSAAGMAPIPTGTSGKVAAYVNGGVVRVSRGGAAVTADALGSGSFDFSSGALVEMGNRFGSRPLTVPLRSVAIYKGTFTDAEIQTLAT